MAVRASSAALAASLALLGAPAPAQSTASSAADQKARNFVKLRTKVLAEAGQRHLRLGDWARDQGLIPQATAQFLRAVEISEGHNPGAQKVLAVMRALDDRFWLAERKRPSQQLLDQFEKRSMAIEQQTREDHADLAKKAHHANTPDLEKRHWRTLLDLGGELAQDDRGVWRLDGHRIPDELVEWLQEQTAPVDDGQGVQRVFEAGGAAAPRLDGAVQHGCERLSVRTDLSRDRAAELHALGLALWPFLQERLDGTPGRQLRLVVFGKRADYVEYLKAIRQVRYSTAPGFTDYGTFQSLVCAEGMSAQDLDGMVLHELSHLFFYGIAPATMPDWYAEGFAEAYGGQGTFTWDGTTLTTGAPMRRDRVQALQQEPLPFDQFLTADAGGLLSTRPVVGLRYYVQAWALQRFLREPDCPWSARFRHFEDKCRGMALGVSEGARTKLGNPKPAADLFQQLFGPDLQEMEQAFLAWLATQ
ncbi:MAG: hypothetical protein AB7O97_21470 [Planctomycetota bacterium]